MAGGALAQETWKWAWGGLLDLVTAGMGESVTLATFPWLNASGIVGMLIGAWLIVGPKLRSVFSKRTSEADLSAALERIAALEEARSATEALNDRLDQIEERVRVASNVARDLGSRFPVLIRIADEKAATDERNLIANLKAEIEAHRRPQPTNQVRDHQRTELEDTATVLGNVIADRLGVSQDIITKFVEERGASIRSDARYCTLSESEKSIWLNEAEKQRWHIRDARLAALLQILGNLDQFRRMRP